MKTKLLFIASLIMLLASCGEFSSGANWFVGFPGDVYEFTTPSGKSCIYATISNGGGLSCNWN